MPVMIQIRNVPDALHARLKEQAAAAGMSLSDFLLRETGKIAERPSLREMLDRLAALPPIELHESPTDVLRAERDSR